MPDKNALDPSWTGQQIEELILENENKIIQAQESLTSLESKRYELKGHFNTRASRICTLPLDILTHIFELACSKNQRNAYFLPVQFIIGRICKYWREVAWGTSSLWCQIFIYFSQSRFCAQKCLLEAWIERSGNHTLGLYLWKAISDDWEPSEDFFCALLRSSHRWAKLYTLTFSGLSGALEARKNITFPLLDTLNLCSSLGCKPLWQWNFKEPPRLRRLFLTGDGTVVARSNLAIDWTSLTELSSSPDMPLLLLASCKSLSVLKCNDIIEDVLTQTSGHHFCFPYLTQLALRTSAYNISLLLDIITTPALIQLDLTIELAEDPVADWTGAVVDLAKRSSFSIQELFLGDRGYNDEVNDVSAVLAQLLPANSIRTINISVPDFSDALLSDPVVAQLALAICNGYGREPGEDCLPTLAEFIYDGNISLSLEAISQMLRSRLICDKKYKEKLNAYRMANDSKPSLGELGSNDGRLELSRTETPKWSSNASSRTGFIMSITYRNIDWFQQQNPNEMQAFYRLVEEFSTEGRQFKLHYGGDIDEP